MMTKQELFEKSVKGLFAQGRRCTSGAKCLYRDGSGSACAFGQLIPDELYTKSLEGMTAGSIAREIRGHFDPSYDHPIAYRKSFIEWFNYQIMPHLGLVSKLQYAHDRRMRPDSSPSEVRQIFTELGTEFELDVSFIADLKWGTEK